MNEEEKEAIEYLSMYAGDEENRVYEGECTYNIEILLNYIHKLQKENEELEKQRDKLFIKDFEFLKENYISKDKIKEALGDKNIPNEMILTYIETLVSENNRLEDIEDRKVQIEYNNVFNKGVKSVEDKIRDKINQIDEEYSKTLEKELSLEFHNINAQRHNAMKIVLEELLGE